MTFENIVDLYLFDMELRHILFSLMKHIEVHLRAVITNYFSLKHGNFRYKDLNNYNKTRIENLPRISWCPMSKRNINSLFS
ncbi:Abi family protein [Peptoniphilus harei]|uniref:Abi family protein n=1 Tax=Peptoniphilus harei TaxID=54005 RepID=UPI00241D7A8C|nr:Abi family protein [Peptoniphilus harei]